EEVYTDTYYGTLRSELERIWADGKHVIFDIDVIGGLRLKSKFPDNALAIFVNPPSLDILKERLSRRGTDSEEKLKERFAKAEHELSFAERFDVILNNFDLGIACAEAEKLVLDFIGGKN
ncbi:MAG TPA: guanylate kinase, partial [Sphingobacterium sp.]|nr:guanylate kinase [Sphingobacterium sp.]